MANDVSTTGGAIQKVGIGIEVVGLTAAGLGIAIPPSEIGAAGVIGVGGIVVILGTGIQGIGSAVKFSATHDLGALGRDVASLLAGRPSARGRAQDIARGITLDEAIAWSDRLRRQCQ